MSRSLQNVRVAIVSRCSRTMHTFRRSLIHRLMADGAKVISIGARGDGFEDRLREEGIEFRHVPVSYRSVNPAADIHLYLRLLRLFREMRPHVVHAFTVKPAIYATLAAAHAGVPVRIVTITGLGHAFTTASPLIMRVVEWLYRAALARAALVFFQNGEDRELFVRRCLVATERARLVPGSGVDTTHFTPVPLPLRSTGIPTFLMIARLLKEKGVVEFLAAAERVRVHAPATRIRLVGGPDARNPSAISPEDIAALRVSRTVEWVGEVMDVRPHIGSADVVVLPSYREGLPRSLLEGGAMGRAVIATDVPGCREVVRDGMNGYLVPPADAQALANAMIRMVDDVQSIERFGRCARELVVERFDERMVISQTISAYLELLGSAEQPEPRTAAV